MNYVQFIWADGHPPPEDIAVLQRELPAWGDEMRRRGTQLFGRELDDPRTAATVRVRDGEMLVTDGPFAETKEFVAGFDVLDCADLAEAIEFAATCPISRFQPLEIRPFSGELRLSEQAFAFGRSEDGDARPYLLSTFIGDTPARSFDEQAVMEEGEAWRRDLQARGLHVLGHPLDAKDTARTVRVQDGETVVSDGPFTKIEEFVAGIDVVSCADRRQAIELAAAHPIARYHAIEVRPFYVG